MLSFPAARLHATIFGLLALCSGSLLVPSVACGQTPRTQADADVALVVDGRTEGVYRDGDRCLVQILVRRSEAPRLESPTGVRYPAPGESVYVHVDLQNSGLDRVIRRSDVKLLPDPQSRIRAFLTVGVNGRWEASGRDWFEPDAAAGGTVRNDRWPLDRSRRDPGIGREDDSIGVETQRVVVGRGQGLKVIRVRPDSAAAKAGFEPGDVLVAVDGERLTSQPQLEDAFRVNTGKFTVTVRDVRTDRDVQVEVSGGGGEMPRASRNAEPLGIETELAFYDGETALKVTQVDPNSPAQRSGIVPGLLILKAAGESLANPAALREAESQSRGSLQLEVVDPRQRRVRRVRVEL